MPIKYIHKIKKPKILFNISITQKNLIRMSDALLRSMRYTEIVSMVLIDVTDFRQK